MEADMEMCPFKKRKLNEENDETFCDDQVDSMADFINESENIQQILNGGGNENNLDASQDNENFEMDNNGKDDNKEEKDESDGN